VCPKLITKPEIVLGIDYMHYSRHKKSSGKVFSQPIKCIIPATNLKLESRENRSKPRIDRYLSVFLMMVNDPTDLNPKAKPM